MDSIRLVHQILENAAALCPEKEAVVHGKERRSYRYIEEEANRLANFLRGAGLEQGERVGILMQNSVDFICAYMGISKSGGVSVPINTAASARGLEYILEDAGVRFLLCQEGMKAAVPEAPGGDRFCFSYEDRPLRAEPAGRGRADARARSLREILLGESCEPPGLSFSDQDLACLLYTSGSTGNPKGVMLTHSNIVENTKSIVEYLGLDRDDKVMVVLPFYYCYGASLLHTHFWVGGTLVLENQFLFPNRVLEKMRDEKVTGFAGVPSTFAILLRRSNIRAFAFDHLRYVTQAGGAMAPSLIRELKDTLAKTRVFVMYGQTEATARLSYLPPECLETKLGSIGRGIPNVELKVMSERGDRVRPGEVGEIVARGPNVMKGYWNSPEATREVLDGGGELRTGDLARVDEDGFIYIVDRKKDMIKSGAHRVSAREIEDVMLEDPSVLECAVIGVEDEMLGESIKAFVVPAGRDGLDEERIIRFCKERLPPYKVPRYVEVIRELPKSEAGKVLKAVLRGPYPAAERSPSDSGAKRSAG